MRGHHCGGGGAAQEAMHSLLQGAVTDFYCSKSLNSYNAGRNVWTVLEFCRKVPEHVQVLLTLSVSFHVLMFHCKINVLMTSGMTCLHVHTFGKNQEDFKTIEN